MQSKLTSRKFWVAVAAFLASIGASIAGLAIEDHTITVAGVVCTMLSTAIYAACEAWVDASNAKSSTSSTSTVTSVTATATGKAVLESLNVSREAE